MQTYVNASHGAPTAVGLRPRAETALPLQAAVLFLIPSGLMLANMSGLSVAALVLASGFGTFVFLRRFGLNIAAALTSAVLWQTNTVLAPALLVSSVALPWLFYAIESLWDHSFHQRHLSKHALLMAMAAVTGAALAAHGVMADRMVYIGLATAWAIFRGATLLGPQAMTYCKDVVTAAILGAVISATPVPPHSVMMAGFDFPWAQYVVPMVFVPLVLAAAGMFIARSAPVKIFLVLTIAVILAVRTGLIGHGDVTLHADASWMFCVVMLTALFVDGVPALPRTRIHRAVAMGTASVAVCVVAAAVWTWPTLA